MTADEVSTYARAILAHIDVLDGLHAGETDAAVAAFIERERALDAITALSGHLRGRAFARVVLMARDAMNRRTLSS